MKRTLLLLFVCLFVGINYAQVTVKGTVISSENNEPLIVLDGMSYEGGWNNINPADVESISILKDAASTALYGARGANGVIIITTKSAKAGDAKITVDAKWSANTRGEIDVVGNRLSFRTLSGRS